MKAINIEGIDLNKIKTSVKKSYSKGNKLYKYYIEHYDNDEIIPLITRPPQNDWLL